MDEAETADYVEPCALCSDVNWAIGADLKYYCKSCHNVIDKMAEVDDHSFMDRACRVTDLTSFRQRRVVEYGRKWKVCEGFQFILKHQAQALVLLGVSPEFKKNVMCQLWRLYLQKSRQAYTKTPMGSEVPLAAEAKDPAGARSASQTGGSSASETDEGRFTSDTEGGQPSAVSSGASSDEDRPKRRKVYQSGSEDSSAYLPERVGRSRGLMSMTKTLALLYLGLLWCREALSLGDLLRLVKEGHLPFINAFECLPEEMKLFGRDLYIFRVQSIPSYRAVHREAFRLALYLGLPRFPPLVPQCLLHPTLLTLRYLVLLNLPDQLHPWVCRVIKEVGLDQEPILTFNPPARVPLPFYDVQAAAVIVVTLKLLFGVDDRSEWDLSNAANDKNTDDPDQSSFSVRRWYRLLQAALLRARQREEEHTARMRWTAEKTIYPSWEKKASFIKKRRMAEQLRTAFTRLSGGPAEPEPPPPASFQFRWGEGGGEGEEGGDGGEGGWDGPSLSHQTLDAVVGTSGTPVNVVYWHPALKKCKPWVCKSHYEEEQASLPRTYCWLLDLLAFLLGVTGALLHEEVLRVERLLVGPQRGRSWGAGAQEERTRRRRRWRGRSRSRSEGETRKSGGAVPGRYGGKRNDGKKKKKKKTAA